MLRSLLALFAGLVLGVTVVWIIELPAMLMYPLPAGLDPYDKPAMKEYVATLPVAVQACGVLAWTAGSFAGAWLAARLARRAFLVHGLVIGLFFLATDTVMIFAIAHPLWLAVLGIIAPPAAAFFGASLAARSMRSRTTGPHAYDMREKNMAC